MDNASGPLSGLRVLEFAGIGPGPHVAMLLADLGAEVVRVDRPGARPTNPVVERARHRLALDLKSDGGKAAILAAAAKADVLIEGFRPGVMERLGLGPDALLAANPRLVYARMTGWGQEGPLAQASQTATPPQNLVGDFGGGSMYCAFGIMAALYERETSGKGQVVDAAIVDGATSLMSFFFGVRGVPHLSTERGKGMAGRRISIAASPAPTARRSALAPSSRSSTLKCWPRRARPRRFRKVR